MHVEHKKHRWCIVDFVLLHNTFIGLRSLDFFGKSHSGDIQLYLRHISRLLILIGLHSSLQMFTRSYLYFLSPTKKKYCNFSRLANVLMLHSTVSLLSCTIHHFTNKNSSYIHFFPLENQNFEFSKTFDWWGMYFRSFKNGSLSKLWIQGGWDSRYYNKKIFILNNSNFWLWRNEWWVTIDPGRSQTGSDIDTYFKKPGLVCKEVMKESIEGATHVDKFM